MTHRPTRYSDVMDCPVWEFNDRGDREAAQLTVMCLPGAMLSPAVFAPMAHRLTLNVCALGWMETRESLDLRSVAERLLSFATDNDPVVLVGQSVGSTVAALTAIKSVSTGADVIRGVVLSNSGPNNAGHRDVAQVIRDAQEQWGPPFWHRFVDRCLHMPVALPIAEEMARYPAPLDKDAVVEVAQSQNQIDLLPDLPQLTRVPVAVVHGRFDAARTMDHARQLAEATTAQELCILDCGHTAVLEMPAQFASVVERVAAASAWEPRDR